MNRVLVVNQEKTWLNAFGRLIAITCDVRNLENGKRARTEVVRTEPPKGGGLPVPYSPRVFPSGAHLITAITAETDPDLAPWFIATDAVCLVEEWELDLHGFYLRPTGRLVKDSWYGVHNSEDPHTLGCLRVSGRDDLLWLVNQIWNVWDGKEPNPKRDTVELDVA